MLLFMFGCDDNPLIPPNDCAGVSGGSAFINECNLCVGGTSDVVDFCDTNEDGYDDRDIQVLQDFIDLNESLTGQNPLDIDSQEWVEGRLAILNLNYNQLTSIPESIADLSSLEYLYLEWNQLSSIPESIGDLSNLTELYLSHNQLTSLPESIGDLSNLEYLSLNYNQLTSIPENVGDLSNLTELYLSHNQLTSIPETIGDLSSLLYLYLHYNQLTSLPESICNLPSSCSIWVHDNYLCEEYHFPCIDLWGTQDQDDCCEGPEGQPNWTDDCD